MDRISIRIFWMNKSLESREIKLFSPKDRIDSIARKNTHLLQILSPIPRIPPLLDPIAGVQHYISRRAQQASGYTLIGEASSCVCVSRTRCGRTYDYMAVLSLSLDTRLIDQQHTIRTPVPRTATFCIRNRPGADLPVTPFRISKQNTGRMGSKGASFPFMYIDNRWESYWPAQRDQIHQRLHQAVAAVGNLATGIGTLIHGSAITRQNGIVRLFLSFLSFLS